MSQLYEWKRILWHPKESKIIFSSSHVSVNWVQNRSLLSQHPLLDSEMSVLAVWCQYHSSHSKPSGEGHSGPGVSVVAVGGRGSEELKTHQGCVNCAQELSPHPGRVNWASGTQHYLHIRVGVTWEWKSSLRRLKQETEEGRCWKRNRRRHC